MDMFIWFIWFMDIDLSTSIQTNQRGQNQVSQLLCESAFFLRQRPMEKIAHNLTKDKGKPIP